LSGWRNLVLSPMAEQSNDQLQKDLESGEFRHGVEQRFWSLLDRAGDVLHVKFFPRTGEPFVMRLDCDGYKNQAIGGKFVDPDTRACVSSAWPSGKPPFDGWVKWAPGNLFICWPGDRYGIQHHPDWASLQLWKRSKNQLVDYLEFIRWLLWNRGSGYTGRAA